MIWTSICRSTSAVSCQEMKDWLGSRDPMRDHSSWVFWDREQRQAWWPAVALTAGTTMCGDRRPRAQRDAVTRLGRNPASQALSIPLCKGYFRFAFKSPKISKVKSQSNQRDRARVIFLGDSVDGSKHGGGGLTSNFLKSCAKAQPVGCALTEVEGLWALPYILYVCVNLIMRKEVTCVCVYIFI